MGDLLKGPTDRDRMHERRGLERAARYARKLAKESRDPRPDNATARAYALGCEDIARWCEHEARRLPRCP